MKWSTPLVTGSIGTRETGVQFTPSTEVENTMSLAEQLARNRVLSLPVTNAHAWRVAELPPHHRDPFDRLLIAQSMVEKLPILSLDRAFGAYDVQVVS